MSSEKFELTAEQKTEIASEIASIIVGRILRTIIILAGVVGLFMAGFGVGKSDNASKKVVDSASTAS